MGCSVEDLALIGLDLAYGPLVRDFLALLEVNMDMDQGRYDKLLDNVKDDLDRLGMRHIPCMADYVRQFGFSVLHFDKCNLNLGLRYRLVRYRMRRYVGINVHSSIWTGAEEEG